MEMEQVIKEEMRLFVLETLVSLLWAAQHQVTGDPAASVSRIKNLLIEKARRQTFGQIGPAYSDLLSAELESAIDDALAMQETWLGLNRPQVPPQAG